MKYVVDGFEGRGWCHHCERRRQLKSVTPGLMGSRLIQIPGEDSPGKQTGADRSPQLLELCAECRAAEIQIMEICGTVVE